ncbi:MAG: hypothetical protein JWR08_1063 [Enterovirga sp.]|jgi:hypothetical protein|nr:hypothetical protein [Enterovirga sp.]
MAGYDGNVAGAPARADGAGVIATEVSVAGVHIIGLGAGANPLRGVLLDLGGDVPDLRVRLVDESGRAMMSLGPFPDEEVIAIWRSLASASGLTALMRAGGGQIEPLAPQLGPVRIGRTKERRRTAGAVRRRPRFLLRRKGASLPRRPQIYREREIAGGVGV